MKVIIYQIYNITAMLLLQAFKHVILHYVLEQITYFRLVSLYLIGMHTIISNAVSTLRVQFTSVQCFTLLLRKNQSWMSADRHSWKTNSETFMRQTEHTHSSHTNITAVFTESTNKHGSLSRCANALCTYTWHFIFSPM